VPQVVVEEVQELLQYQVDQVEAVVMAAADQETMEDILLLKDILEVQLVVH